MQADLGTDPRIPEPRAHVRFLPGTSARPASATQPPRASPAKPGDSGYPRTRSLWQPSQPTTLLTTRLRLRRRPTRDVAGGPRALRRVAGRPWNLERLHVRRAVPRAHGGGSSRAPDLRRACGRRCRCSHPGSCIRTFIVFHDCAHGSFLPSKRTNAVLGAVLGVLVYTPFAVWRREHAVHHATAGDLDRRGVGDVQTLTVDEYRPGRGGGRLGYRLFRNPLVMFGLGPLWVVVLEPRIVSWSAPRRASEERTRDRPRPGYSSSPERAG